jgi:hypothetical protein
MLYRSMHIITARSCRVRARMATDMPWTYWHRGCHPSTRVHVRLETGSRSSVTRQGPAPLLVIAL